MRQEGSPWKPLPGLWQGGVKGAPGGRLEEGAVGGSQQGRQGEPPRTHTVQSKLSQSCNPTLQVTLHIGAIREKRQNRALLSLLIFAVLPQ